MTVTSEDLLRFLEQTAPGAPHQTFGEHLKQWRREQGYEPSAFARRVGVSAQTVHRWEQGFSPRAKQKTALRHFINEVSARSPPSSPLSSSTVLDVHRSTRLELVLGLTQGHTSASIQALIRHILAHPDVELLSLSLK